MDTNIDPWRDRGTCSIEGCDNPKWTYASGYPASMCRDHDVQYSSFRRDMQKRTGSSRGAAGLFNEQVQRSKNPQGA